jgi:hypothetical protein
MERHLRLASRPSTAASDDAPRVGRPERDEDQLRKRRESEVLPGGLVERWRKTPPVVETTHGAGMNASRVRQQLVDLLPEADMLIRDIHLKEGAKGTAAVQFDRSAAGERAAALCNP